MQVFHQLLAKAVIKRAATNSVANVNASATRLHTRNAAIIQLLQAPWSVRQSARIEAEAADTVGKRQLLDILVNYELMSPEKKLLFIDAFKTAATVGAQGQSMAAHQTVWDPGHVPARYQP